MAAAKIRDENDYRNLIRVDYQPVLESNTSLIEGNNKTAFIFFQERFWRLFNVKL